MASHVRCVLFSDFFWPVPISFLSGWWFGTWFLFFHLLGIIIPSDFHIVQRGRYTTNQYQIPFYFFFNTYRIGKTSKTLQTTKPFNTTTTSIGIYVRICKEQKTVFHKIGIITYYNHYYCGIYNHYYHLLSKWWDIYLKCVTSPRIRSSNSAVTAPVWQSLGPAGGPCQGDMTIFGCTQPKGATSWWWTWWTSDKLGI